MTTLSPLAQRIYEVLVRETTRTSHGGYMAAWHISEALGEHIGLCGVPGPGVEAMRELSNAALVEEVPDLGCRYQLTARAWQQLLAAERERANQLQQIICEILGEFSSEMRYVPHDQEQRWRRAAGLSEIKG